MPGEIYISTRARQFIGHLVAGWILAAPSYDVNGSGTFFVTASNSCGEADTIHVDYVIPTFLSWARHNTLSGRNASLSSPSIF
ncbi:MAG: hypothetical protein IPP25_12890 [Saprospiraceae bacterium]|nr:hypothetical protein [Candidatus Opimibacter skivensis]